MIETLSTYDIANRLLRDSNACWTRPGALALAQYLQNWEEETDQVIEYDAVAIRCDWSEYPSAVDAHNTITQGHDLTEDEEETALGRLREVGEVIEFDGGVIISN
jgi:hypothetical protein